MVERDHSIAGKLRSTIGIVLLAVAACLLPAERAAAQPLPAACNDELGGVDLIDHDLNASSCELCGTGRVRIVVENPTRNADRTDLSQIIVEEDLRASGLTYAGNLSFAGSNVAVPAPTVQVLGGVSERVRFTFPSGFTLDGRTGGPFTPRRLVISFDVERQASFDEEGLISADRRIEATLVVDPDCAPGASYGTSTGVELLALDEPELIVRKRGRNLDHAQNNWRRPVYAHAGDDVIWRIQVINNGDAPLYDFKFSDTMVPGNFDISHVCDGYSGAVDAANTGSGATCVSVSGAPPITDIDDFDPRTEFGGGAPNYVIAPAGGSNNFYIVGKVISSCVNRNNTVYDVEWGCESDSPLGGIDEAASGAGPFSQVAGLVTDSNPANLDIQVDLTGVNTGQSMGARGFVNIRIENTTRGTITGGAAPIELWNQLPPEYVIDPTFTPTITVVPEFGPANTYDGMVNQVTWANPEPGSVPHDPGDQVAPLQNGNLRFLLSSDSTQVEAGYPDRNHVIRHGDVVTITFRTVLIDPTYYDPTANIDVREEAPDSDPLNTDPDPDFDITDSGRIEFYELCNAGTLRTVNFSQDDIAEPEDLDVDIVGSELLFILTDQPDPLTLTASLTNRGGHDATDYELYVTFGQAMQVQTVAQDCTLATAPTNYPTWWEDPNDLPNNPSIYVCNREPIGPGQTEVFAFDVIKNPNSPFEDDLTFRADVVGKIMLSNDVPLNFPAPLVRTDGVLDVSNDYSVDAIRARVVGYNLTKMQVGTCTENLAVAGTPDSEVEIGEECNYRIRSGGWFGFDTPGFTYIAVQNVRVDDLNPDGQGFISNTDPDVTSSDQILGISFLPPPTPLADAPFYWTFSTNVPTERIDQLDEWFEVDFKTRILNDPIDTVLPPNEHEAISSNVLTSTFDAVFENPLTGLEEIFSLGPSTVGYPLPVHRTVDLTVTEPRLTLLKEVCNETLNGTGPSCASFLPFVDDGDAFDTYIYRIAVTNEEFGGTTRRAPAYDVTVRSITDGSDLLYVDPLDADGLDNEADVDVDAADLNGEGAITDNVTQMNGPAEVVFSHTDSDELLKIEPNETVYLYYRVDPDDDVAPQQQLTSTVTASYDSLEGPSGAQDAPQGANGEAGGARQYVSQPAQATIEIIPVQVSPKEITRTASSALVAPPTEQPVSIGEEVEFQLRALIPVAQLRSFVIRDVLPAGLSCSEAPEVNLDAAPYAAARFMPGGRFMPTCTDTEVVWDFGDQTVRESNRTDRRFDFAVQFIARVDNIPANQDGLSIENGGTATETTVNYVNQAGSPVALPLESATVQIGEPLIALTKAFSVPQVDALDVPRVTVTATNNGSATAYNLRVLDDLSAGEMSYAGAIGGPNSPTVDVATFGPDRPVFSWTPDLPIAPGQTISFSFAVQVGAVPEPHQILANTIQADWTSLPGQTTALNSTGLIGADGSPTGMRIGALPNVVAPPLNDYQAEATASMVVPPPTLAKLDLDPALAPEIGLHKPFEVTVALPEGTTRDVLVTDALDTGSVSYVLSHNADYDITYDFQGIASINGQAPTEAAFLSFPADGASGNAVWNVGDVVTQGEDDLATNALSPSIRISYAARVNNDLVTDAGDTLQNNVTGNYTNGETAATESLVDGTAAIVAVEPVVTATKLLENVTPGKASGDNPAYDDILRYTITVVNNGTAIAHDVTVTDNLPPELTLHAPFTPTAEIGPGFVPGFLPTPNGAPDGPLLWGRGNSDLSLDIPAGGSLRLIYQVRVRTPIIDPTVLENRVWVDWTSLDALSTYERTGDGCPTITAPNDYCFGPAVATGTAEPVAEPDAAAKANTQPTAAIGEVFSYRITIPEVPYAFPIYDVRVHDDLTASAADMRFVGVTRIAGLDAWTPVNTGTPTNIVIEDTTTNGIDIPAGDQIVIEISVVLQDNPAVNTIGLPFTNTSSYIYNWVDGDDASQRPGLPGTTAPMTIVGPDTVIMQKSGPAQLVIGAPQTFTLDLQNTGSSPAWNTTIVDRLPDSPTGGTCDVAPTLLNVQVFDDLGTGAISAPLVQGTDYDFNFVVVGPASCEFTLAVLSAAGAIGPDERLIVTYETELDSDTQDAVALTNVAGATQWYSAEGADRHEYTGVVTTGTVGTDDSQDAHTTTSALPSYLFEKTVTNVSTGQSPAVQARPGETLRYRLYVENLSAVPMANFSLQDEIDALNPGATFVPGSLQLVLPLPGGADSSNTNIVGGANGTGLVDIRNLSLPGLNDSLAIEFDVILAPVLAAGSYATNQSQLLIGGVPFAWSDDPGVNGQADPMVPGDEDPTRVLIDSMPAFRVQKVSADISGDPAVLLAGETLEYTITVKNIGSDNATDAELRDQVPVNTSYVPGSTTLNGVAVPDGAGGLAPLTGGLLISAPEDPTPGAMRADASATQSNVATIVFQVVVAPNVPDGTVISNQGYVSAVGGGVVDQPSDDPATPVADDPTRNVVGNLPLLFAAKDVAIETDIDMDGAVDPGDVLRYTITIRNNGAIPATGAMLSDAVPANTTYVNDSVTLNTVPVGRPDGGVSPLIAGIDVSSSDQPSPPAPGMGTLTPGEVAVVEFLLTVNAGTPAGTIISNQALVNTNELPNLPTDGDGDPATGPEPTVVVVGDGQQLSITKTVSVVGGGAALPGSELEYVVQVRNIATVPADDVVITDDLSAPVANQLSYVGGSGTLNGDPLLVNAVGPLITADYSTTNGPLPPGATLTLRFRAVLDAGLALGTTVTNTGVVTWNDPPQTANASVSLDVGGMPGVGVLSGTVWHDENFDLVTGGTERVLQGWIVELLLNGTPIHTATVAADGTYTIGGLVPNDVSGDQYELRFRAPDAGANTGSLGLAQSPFTNGPQQIGSILVTSGSNLLGMNLPITPNGVVYDSVQRIPVAGAVLAMLNASSGAALPTACFDDPLQQGQVSGADGYYKFDLNFTDPACPSGASYLIEITGAGSQHTPGFSQIIPPETTAATTPHSVPTCPGGVDDAVAATAQYCEVQASAFAPPVTVAPRTAGSRYHAHLVLDATQQPGSSQIFNNHIAMDPALDTDVSIIKSTPSTNVVLGQLVPYEITVGNETIVDLNIDIVDRFPAGFRYIEGSARLDDVPNEPQLSGRELTWSGIDIAPTERRSLKLLLAIGAGVGEGEFSNRAQALNSVGAVPLSGEASATVRVVPDPDFACTDVMGRVFDDADRDGYQDDGELGLQGVRLATARGLIATTDQHGRFHITCAIVPREGRGSNFVLKLDDRSLPSGYRLSTRQLQIKRATRGKALRFSYGASIHRVVGLDLADAAFEPGGTELRAHWRERITPLLEELQKAPATLRLSYVADVEDAKLVDARLDAIKDEIGDAWKALDAYPLTIEPEVFWRRGAPSHGLRARLPDLGRLVSGANPIAGPPKVSDARVGNAVERHLSSEVPITEWTQDPALLETEAGDRLEEQEVLKEQAETVKLKDVVPPIRFEAGASEISPSYLQQLRRKLNEMQHLENVRLHFVGHADDQPLSAALARRYGDNEGLSRERAGEVAEFVQNALDLPPEAISFSWAGEAEPLASNATAEGRALNRRVEVEVWYDEIGEKVGFEEVVVSDDFKRVKVCRVETVCKMRFIEGHERRARLKNLVPPLHLEEGQAGVPADYTRKIGQALENLREKQNLTVKFVGFTDDSPLEGRNQRIYGTHLSLSRANARRVALAIRESLDLSSSAVSSDGHGVSRPIASNQTANGRSLNRRIEVEFWYDDPLQELPDEPQPCPDAAGDSLLTKVYEPPWGRLPAVPVDEGDAEIPEGFTDSLRRAMADVAGKANVRLRFLGYTGNERLDRRTAMVYGDDIGLSAARARRTKESIQAQLGLSDAQVEHEGRGFVHSNDVVNAGFIQGETSHVVAQVVYDEPSVLDDYEGVEITELTRELTPKDPLALNLMRITVDGEPIDDPGRSSQDVQRCTDVALESADVEFRFDGLEASPRLSVTSSASSVAVPAASATSDASDASATSDASDAKSAPGAASSLRFKMYTNYSHFIERAEVRVFERGQSVQAEPLAVVEVGPDGVAQWQPEAQRLAGPVRPLEFVLRAYGAKGRFDETAPQSLWMVPGGASVPVDIAVQDSDAEPDEGGEGDAAGAPLTALTTSGGTDTALLAGYGESGPLIRNIDLGDVGSVRVQGGGVPSDHSVWLAGEPVPVDESGQFVAEVLLPKGMHTVEVSMLDAEGNGDLFLRDLDFDTSEWFYVAMADFTFSANKINGPEEQLQGENSSYDPDSFADGRLAFYLTGKFDKFGRDWRLTASADTREGKVEDLFSNFLDKSPGSLFRRIDPDYHYPTFGDDGTVNETAATSGKFFVKLDQKENHALWGNFNVGYVDNELARVERGLYGFNVHYQTEGTTRFGERRVMLDGFAADPGTVPSREAFRGTGGSLYYTRHRDILVGSERLLVEVRDKDSGLVTSVVQLDPDLDYDIDYFQGRILLAEPVSSTVEDNLLVRSESLSGNQAWLVVNYEYAPGFDEIDQLAAGGTGHYWLNDFFKVGFTAYSNEEDGVESGLYGANLVARMSTESWLKFQGGFSQGLVSSTYRSNDGGFDFDGTAVPGSEEGEAGAFRVDGKVGFDDIIGGTGGQLSFYYQRLYAGYSAPGLNALNDTDHYGGTIDMPLLDRLNAAFKADRVVETDGLETTALEADVRFSWSEELMLSAGVRNEDREDNAAVVPATQNEGTRTDLVVEAAYDPGGKWKGYAFGQATVQQSGSREANNRGGVGGSYRLNDRFEVDGEVSYGNSGAGVELGTNFQQTDQTSRYLNYSLDNERAANGVHARRGNLISGARTRLSESASVYMEDRYQHSKADNGLSRAVGLDWAPDERWSLGLDWEYGTLFDRRTNAKTNRNAGGGRVGYHYDKLQISSGIEYRADETEQTDGSWSDRTTWLFRNNFRVQLTPDWRLLGKFNHSFSDSSLGEFYDGGYTEAVLGYAYRPVENDRLNVLAKYTYFYNRPTTDVVGQEDTSAEYLQKSHILSLDGTYDLTRSLTIGGKYAYRFGAVSLTRENPEFFDNSAHLVLARGDYRFLKNWETSLEGRMLLMPSLNERKGGAVITIYRYLGKNFKIGIGYNFTDFSEDLTDLSYDHHGFFFNLIGTL